MELLIDCFVWIERKSLFPFQLMKSIEFTPWAGRPPNPAPQITSFSFIDLLRLCHSAGRCLHFISSAPLRSIPLLQLSLSSLHSIASFITFIPPLNCRRESFTHFIPFSCCPRLIPLINQLKEDERRKEGNRAACLRRGNWMKTNKQAEMETQSVGMEWLRVRGPEAITNNKRK